MATPEVVMNFGKSTHIRFKEGAKYDYFISGHGGTVKVVKFTKPLSSQLTPVVDQAMADPKNAAKNLMDSTFEKTEKATQILTCIIAGEELPELPGLESSPDGDLETKKLTPKQKMNVVGDGAAAVAKKAKKKADDEAAAEKDAKSKTKKTKTAKPAKAEKDPDIVSLNDICTKHKWEGSEARKLMRAAKWKKPEGRWEWPKKEADQVEADLEKLFKAAEKKKKDA